MASKLLLIGGIVGAIGFTAVVVTAGAGSLRAANFAEVLAVSPVSRTVAAPREECRDQLVSVQRSSQAPTPTAGTVAGDGEKVPAVAGDVAAGDSGKKVQEGMQQRNVVQVIRSICEKTVDTRQERDGYDVTYRLDGKERTVRLTDDPGRQIRIEDG